MLAIVKNSSVNTVFPILPIVELPNLWLTNTYYQKKINIKENSWEKKENQTTKRYSFERKREKSHDVGMMCVM